MLPSIDGYLDESKIEYWLMPSRDIGDQRILQSNWLKEHQAITQEPGFSKTFFL